MLGAVLGPDCEAFRDGPLGQATSTVSSLAFLAVGVWCWASARRPDAERAELVAFGAATILVGLGSTAFHGPHPGWSGWAHDASIAWLLLLTIAVDVERRTGRRRRALAGWAAGCCVVAVIFALAPESQRAVFTLLGAVLVALETDAIRRHRRPRPGEAGFGRYALAVGAFGLGTVSFFLARWDPACDPTSWVQGHALWHVLLAAAIAAFVDVTLVRRVSLPE